MKMNGGIVENALQPLLFLLGVGFGFLEGVDVDERDDHALALRLGPINGASLMTFCGANTIICQRRQPSGKRLGMLPRAMWSVERLSPYDHTMVAPNWF